MVVEGLLYLVSRMKKPSKPNTLLEKKEVPEEPISTSSEKLEKLLDSIFSPIDVLGKKLLGGLWCPIYLSVQDAIALSLLFHLPGWIIEKMLNEKFYQFDACLIHPPYSVRRYACLTFVTGDFLTWIAILVRIVIRFVMSFKEFTPRNFNNRKK